MLVGGGVVVVKVFGKKELIFIKIKLEVVDEDDVEMFEDLVVSVVNEVLKKVDEEIISKMGKLIGGMLGGLF